MLRAGITLFCGPTRVVVDERATGTYRLSPFESKLRRLPTLSSISCACTPLTLAGVLQSAVMGPTPHSYRVIKSRDRRICTGRSLGHTISERVTGNKGGTAAFIAMRLFM